jgi:hypothetical protein
MVTKRTNATNPTVPVTVFGRNLILSSPSTGDPWVMITMDDDIIRLEETNRLIELGHILCRRQGFKRSADVGKSRPDGSFDSNINEGRTSIDQSMRGANINQC